MTRRKKIKFEIESPTESLITVERDIVAAVRDFANHKTSSAFDIMALGKKLIALEKAQAPIGQGRDIEEEDF